MMNKIKNEFTINELENFSGIKAHTIRIWEKRYGLFNPKRRGNNVRYYGVSDLVKILNIALLNTNGYKISKIAELSDAKISAKAKEFALAKSDEQLSLDSLKLSMLNFDQILFNKTYYALLEKYSFGEIFLGTFNPFLKQLGFLWQVGSITPAHEHFISGLILQKLFLNIEKVQATVGIEKAAKVYVLFLPENEIHELGLLYLNYELLLHGHFTVYLGTSVPIENLEAIQDVFDNIIFVGGFVTEPAALSAKDYYKNFYEKILKNSSNQLFTIGAVNAAAKELNEESVRFFECLEDFISYL